MSDPWSRNAHKSMNVESVSNYESLVYCVNDETLTLQALLEI